MCLIDSFFFWLPFYLHAKFSWQESEADLLSTLYDVGGIIGGIVGGLLSVNYMKIYFKKNIFFYRIWSVYDQLLSFQCYFLPFRYYLSSAVSDYFL
jgi:sugar phosphate permease